MLQKYKAMTLYEFWIYPLPTNLKELEEQNSHCGRTFHFLHSLNRIHCNQKYWTHWTAQTISGMYQTSKRNSQNASMSGPTTETSITDTVLALWIVSSN